VFLVEQELLFRSTWITQSGVFYVVFYRLLFVLFFCISFPFSCLGFDYRFVISNFSYSSIKFIVQSAIQCIRQIMKNIIIIIILVWTILNIFQTVSAVSNVYLFPQWNLISVVSYKFQKIYSWNQPTNKITDTCLN
jgi:hypothetical protein